MGGYQLARGLWGAVFHRPAVGSHHNNTEDIVRNIFGVFVNGDSGISTDTTRVGGVDCLPPTVDDQSHQQDYGSGRFFP